MKQKNYVLSIPWRMLCYLIFCAMPFANTAQAQTGAFVAWSHQVGCIEYGNEGDPKDPKRLILLEDIQDAPCVRVCVNTSVNYSVYGDNVSSVTWTATGGSIINTYPTGTDILWGGVGNGTIGMTITYTDNSVQNISLCIEIIASPIAKFELYGVGAEPVFCVDSDIYFHNMSVENGGTDIYSYSWDFGDGTYSNAFEPVHHYTQPGNYTVKFHAYNLCNCFDSYSMEIKIEEKPVVEIYCPSVVCEGQTATYTASDNCGGDWEVVGGTIVSNNGVSIEVAWDHVEPDGFGTINYKSGCLCPFWTSIRVPVVLGKGQITGPEMICLNDQGVFTMPQWPTTDFEWELEPINNPGSSTQLIYTSQRNEIVVDALSPGDYVLRSKYMNTLVGCKGEAEIVFTVGYGTEILGDKVICSNTVHTYENADYVSVAWTLRKNNTIITTQVGTSFTYDFPDAGIFTLSLADSASDCPSEAFSIEVYETPAAPQGPIDGDTRICPGSPYEYTITNANPAFTYEWTVANGTIQGSSTGETIAVIFNASGPYQVSVTQKMTAYPGCTSDALVLNVLPISPQATISNSQGLTIFCPSSEATFTAAFGNFVPDYIEWTIADGFGSVIDGGNTPTVTVNWNEISAAGPNGVLTLHVKVCGADYYFNKDITLFELPELELTAPAAVCFGALIPVHLDIISTTPVTNGNITWDYGNGQTHTTAINATGNYNLPNLYTNNSGSNVTYTMVAMLNSPNGCSYVPQDSATVLVYPRTTINISPGYNYAVCPATYNGSIVLYANAMTGLNVTATYQWFKGSSPIPNATGSNYTVGTGSPAGVYTVRVTDSNGCVVTSSPVTVTANCGPVQGCSIPANANINLEAHWTACNTISANITYNGTATVSWSDGPLEDLVSSGNYGAQYYTNVPGVHLIIATITFQTPQGPCSTTRTVEVETHYKPDFNYAIACNNNGTGYNVTLFDNSTVFGVDPVNNPFTYTFSGPGMATQTGHQATASNLAPGSYNFTLQITSPDGPPCTVTKTVVLDALPVATFLPLDSFYCAESPITLTVTNYNPDNTYEWFFNGTSIIASGPSTLININTGGSYNVTLQERTPYSCDTQNTSANFDVFKAFFNGSLEAFNSPACRGDNPGPSITYDTAGATPSSLIWMRGDQVVATTAGNTFYPSSTGTYWAIAYDANGCKYADIDPVPVVIISKPQVGVSGTEVVCNGEESVVHGTAPASGVEYRWLINSYPAYGAYGTWSATTPLDVPVDGNNPGTFTYTLEVRPVDYPACDNSASFTVTVHPPVAVPQLSYHVLSCEPYYVQVDASGNPGIYNWTNGSTGATTYTSTGGAIGLTYTDSNGCVAKTTITVPRPLENLAWVVPTGCYSLCFNADPAPYVLAPSAFAVVDFYEWTINNQPYLTGYNTAVSNISVTQAGTYQVHVEKDGCEFDSPEFSVSPDIKNCEFQDCKLEVAIKDFKFEKDVYLVYGHIANPNGFSITVSLSSFNSYGYYVPSSITIPPYGVYNFAPIQFVPNASFTGGTDILIVQSTEMDCIQVVEIKFPEQEKKKMAEQDSIDANLTVMPNPSEHYTIVSYDLGSGFSQAEKLTVHSLLGVPVMERKLHELSGQVQLQTDNLAAGSYVISIEADGERALQKVLIVK
ncbi:PKD domain-containing protein [uncultured Flavobacterium sp.]|uniref:PKD domain-containing protein n=1 Tax=uncultured Flavobacterium sp. TaxID=165435 RepID=UPI0025E65C62|nr:PKD domain-containing protein [uncultured Flavobacterium sp.]